MGNCTPYFQMIKMPGSSSLAKGTFEDLSLVRVEQHPEQSKRRVSFSDKVDESSNSTDFSLVLDFNESLGKPQKAVQEMQKRKVPSNAEDLRLLGILGTELQKRTVMMEMKDRQIIKVRLARGLSGVSQL